MKEVSVSIARIQLGELIEEVMATGKPIVITKSTRGGSDTSPVARVLLVPEGYKGEGR